MKGGYIELKIVYIVNNIVSIGGTERAVINTVNTLVDSSKYEIFILSMNSSSLDNVAFEIDSRVDIIHLNLNEKRRKIIYYSCFIYKIRRVIKSRKIDILVGTTHAINSLLLFVGRKIKKIGCEHTVYSACPNKSNFIRRMLYPRLDALVLLTKSDAEQYTFIKSNKKYVIPNAVSFHCDEPSKLDKCRIIAAGRLVKLKGYDQLIKISKILSLEIPNWHIDIYGEGDEKKQLIAQIYEEKLENFITINSATSDIKKELMSSSIVVMTSEYEGLPMILIEAQTCGLPIVSYDCPEGPRNIIDDEKNGYLIPPNNLHLFASKIINLANDFHLREKMGRCSYEASKKYSQKNIFFYWDNLFNCLDSKK